MSDFDGERTEPELGSGQNTALTSNVDVLTHVFTVLPRATPVGSGGANGTIGPGKSLPNRRTLLLSLKRMA